jgi:hypothetical protein
MVSSQPVLPGGDQLVYDVCFGWHKNSTDKHDGCKTGAYESPQQRLFLLRFDIALTVPWLGAIPRAG